MSCCCFQRFSSCCLLGPLQQLLWFGFLCPCHESDDEYDARDAIRSLESLQIQWCRRCSSCDATAIDIKLEEREPIEASGSDQEDKEETEEDDGAVVWLNSTLNVRDYPQGPVLEISSRDCFTQNNNFVDSKHLLSNNITETTASTCLNKENVLVYWIPLHEIGHVVIDSSSYEGSTNSEIVICSKEEEKELLRFQLGHQEEDCRLTRDEELGQQQVVEHVRSLLLWDKFRRLDLMEEMQREQTWLLEKEIQSTLEDCSTASIDDDDASRQE